MVFLKHALQHKSIYKPFLWLRYVNSQKAIFGNLVHSTSISSSTFNRNITVNRNLSAHWIARYLYLKSFAKISNRSFNRTVCLIETSASAFSTVESSISTHWPIWTPIVRGSLLKTTPPPPGYPLVYGGRYVTPEPKLRALVLNHQLLKEPEPKKPHTKSEIWSKKAVFGVF